MTRASVNDFLFLVLRGAAIGIGYAWFPACAVLLIYGYIRKRRDGNDDDAFGYLFVGTCALILGVVVGAMLWYNALPTGLDAR